MKSGKSVTQNFLTLGSGEIISRLISFGVTIYIARILGADNYGVIAFALGINLYMGKLADFAIEWVGTKEISKNRDSFIPLASAIMGARTALAIILMIVAIFLTQWMLPQPERTILTLYLLTMIPVSMNCKWIHMGLENAKPVSLSRIAGEILGLTIVLLIMTQASRLWVPPAAMIASESLAAILLFITIRTRGYKIKFNLNFKKSFPVFKAALPILVHLLLGLLIYNSDLIFLRMFRDSEHVGYYAAAYMLISFINNIGLSYGMSLLPALTRFGIGSHDQKELYQQSIAIIYAVCLPISIGGFFLAGPIIELTFGHQYTASIFILQVLIWSLPVSMFRNAPWAALIAHERQDLLMKAIIMAAIFNIILNIMFIPEYGMLGAAAATIITESIICVLMFRYAHQNKLPFINVNRFLRPTIAGIAMAFAIYTLGSSNIIIDFFIGSFSYIFILAILGVIQFRKGKLPFLKL